MLKSVTVKRIICGLIISQWALYCASSLDEIFPIYGQTDRGIVSVARDALQNPIFPSPKTFLLRPVLQIFEFISAVTMAYLIQKYNTTEVQRIFDTRFLTLVLAKTSTTLIGLKALSTGRAVEATGVLLVMNLLSWKVVIDLIKRFKDNESAIANRFTRFAVACMMNSFSGFAAFTFIVIMSIVNGVLIHKVGMPESSASFFSLGIITYGLVVWGLLECAYTWKYTTFVFMHGFAFLWIFNDLRDTLRNKESSEQYILTVVDWIYFWIICVMLLKLLTVSYKVFDGMMSTKQFRTK